MIIREVKMWDKIKSYGFTIDIPILGTCKYFMIMNYALLKIYLV